MSRNINFNRHLIHRAVDYHIEGSMYNTYECLSSLYYACSAMKHSYTPSLFPLASNLSIEKLLNLLEGLVVFDGVGYWLNCLGLLDAFISVDNPPGDLLRCFLDFRGLLQKSNEIRESFEIRTISRSQVSRIAAEDPQSKGEADNEFKEALRLNDSSNIFRHFNGKAANLMEILQFVKSDPTITVSLNGKEFKLYCSLAFLNKAIRDRHFLENHLNFACQSGKTYAATRNRPARRVVFYQCRYRNLNCPEGNHSKQEHCDALVVEHQFADKGIILVFEARVADEDPFHHNSVFANKGHVHSSKPPHGLSVELKNEIELISRLHTSAEAVCSELECRFRNNPLPYTRQQIMNWARKFTNCKSEVKSASQYDAVLQRVAANHQEIQSSKNRNLYSEVISSY